MQIGIDDLNPDLRLGVQAYSFLMAARAPGSYSFSDFADVINARYDSPNARVIADAFRAVPDGSLTINPDRTVSVDLPDARAMAPQQAVLSEPPPLVQDPPAALGAQAGARKDAQEKSVPRDFRQEFTDKVVAAIESGQALPWDKPWHTMQGLPRNAVTGKTYSGGNRVVLGLVAMEKGYNDPRWMTVKQSNDLGGHVTKGEKGVMIERWDTKPFWKRLDVELSLGGRRVVVDPKRGVTPEGVHLVGGQTVDPARIAVRHEERTSAGVLVRDYTWKQAERALDLLVGRSYVVFNAEQCTGLKLEPLAPRQSIPVDVRGERLMQAMQADGVRFVHQGSKAYYSPAGDLIALPPRETFKSVEGYYGTALHEIGHATGAEKRLNREGVTGGHAFGSEGYAKEELRAELFSAFMSAETGIPHDDDQHAAYLQSWAKALKNDKNEIFRAAAEAGKAVDYVLAKERSRQLQSEQQQSNEVEAHKHAHLGVTAVRGQNEPVQAERPAPDPAAELKAIWAAKGVSPERQSEMLAQIEAKAQPGAQVGPFVIGAPAPQASAYERAVQNFVRGGGNEKDARRTLDSELAGGYDPKHLPTALVFHGFAKPDAAEKLAAAIIAEGNKQMLKKEDRKASDLQAERPRQRAPQVGAGLER